MSEKTFTECDFCKTLTENAFATKDWITFAVNSSYPVAIHKAKGTGAKDRYDTEALTIGGRRHFCSDHCFIEYLKDNKILGGAIPTPNKPKQNGKEAFIM